MFLELSDLNCNPYMYCTHIHDRFCQESQLMKCAMIYQVIPLSSISLNAVTTIFYSPSGLTALKLVMTSRHGVMSSLSTSSSAFSFAGVDQIGIFLFVNWTG